MDISYFWQRKKSKNGLPFSILILYGLEHDFPGLFVFVNNIRCRIWNERSYFKISTNQDFLVFCKNIAPNSSYENFEGIYMYLQIKADKSVVSDFLFDTWFRSYSLLKVEDI